MKSSHYRLSSIPSLLVLPWLFVSFCFASVQAPPIGQSRVPTTAGNVQHSYFFVGGAYVGDSAKQVMHGQMFVEKLTPVRPHRHYPIVLIHGGAQTATNWMGTPDGRDGWAEFFCSQGYVVYMVDEPARGRSVWQEEVDGKVRSALDAQTIEQLFTAPELYNLWPQAKLHTQWPGNGPKHGQVGDPIFDQFYASQVQFLVSNSETQTLMQNAGSALLDRIGPAIVLTHSQSGPIGWLIADARPRLVKAIVALEPNGPPFQNVIPDNNKARPWGMTDIPITYDPPITDPAQLQIEQQAAPDKADLVRCWSQKAPAHSLVNLRGIPVMLVTSEASYHAQFDHCTARYLVQAGVNTDFVRLEAHGLHGNAHMMMLEKNNLRIAKLITSWLGGNIK
jgi:pimeloyl-ACP methyl ester carboxylesterase